MLFFVFFFVFFPLFLKKKIFFSSSFWLELLAPIYYRKADIVMCIFDLSKPNTLRAALDQIKKIEDQEISNSVSMVVLVGCKLDLVLDDCKYTLDTSEIEKRGIMYFETSAKFKGMGKKVEQLFIDAAMKYEMLKKGVPDPEHHNLSAAEWIPDNMRPNCQHCSKKFTLVTRRHHCRNCGEIFCAQCSSNFMPISRLASKEKVRICIDCAELFESNNK